MKPDYTKFPFDLTIHKHRKKTFKKFLMSLGLSRDTAELACVLVACHRGSLSYNEFFNYIFKDFPWAVIKTK